MSSHNLIKKWKVQNVPSGYHWLDEFEVNTKHAVTLSREELLSDPVLLGCIDLRGNNPEFFSWTADILIERDGNMHGLGGWFESELGEGVWMTNSPIADTPIRRSQAFLPIKESVPVKAGELVKATIMARPSEDLIARIVKFPDRDLRFSLSTWQSMILGTEELKRGNPNRVLRISLEVRARMTISSYWDGQRTVREIEQAVLSNHPDLFPLSGEISRFVKHVLGRNTE